MDQQEQIIWKKWQKVYGNEKEIIQELYTCTVMHFKFFLKVYKNVYALHGASVQDTCSMLKIHLWYYHITLNFVFKV